MPPLFALIRLVHPFPSVLTAAVTVGVATLAGGGPLVAARLGLAMFALQCSIGALNDLVDAPLDASQKPRKPIAAGMVSGRVAASVAAVGAAVGLLLSAVSGAGTLAVAGLGLGLGFWYDLRLSRTAASWLPLALALPLLPIHAWLGAAGTLPDDLLALVPVGVLGGSGLALANGLVDIDRDALAGRHTVAVTLGRPRTWILQTVALLAAAGLAIVIAPSVPAGQAGPLDLLRVIRLGGVGVGAVAIVLGSIVLRSSSPAIRERGWELEALGVAALGLGWLAATAAAASGGGPT